ncbi:starch-binding protein [Prevotella sp. tf2-5]|uniref:starch-binding protein n=1 Tax=Prevotella sp. tf2-5 TaxID=1761889 RepID=UPI0008E51CEC|nr:starch-binding protein [Prevotella sp. tf2-5]SFO44297.1 Starch-binding module 26 [Prevotella sp. tf2-5]
MNKRLYSLLLAVLTLTGLMTGCKSNDDIVFDHERQQFETRADRILLEFIAPFGTTPNEEIYILGAFNGEEEAIGKEEYKLMAAPTSTAKWGVYLDPSTFVNGKSLADGFYFYSVSQGKELDLNGELAHHTDNPGIGTFTNIWGQHWESYYWEGGESPEPEHDGFCVYVDDQTGWDALTLYMWGDVNDLNGGWPGMEVTGTWKHDGVTWKYFDFGEENAGLNENLIFNNAGGGSQLKDFNFTIDRNIYLRITADGVEEISPEPAVKHDGYALFVLNESSQTELALYAWGDAEAFGGWPGMAPTGTQTINGNEYIYFDMGEANTGLNLNLIPNNNNNGVQWEGGDLNFTIDHDIYIRIFDGGYEIIDKDYQPGGDTPTPGPEPIDENVIIAVKNTIGYADPHLYVWGDSEACGGWPGAAPVKVTDNGWYLFELPANGNFNPILNDNGNGSQIDGPAITTTGMMFFDVNTSWELSTNTVTIQNVSGYTDPRLYAWGSGEIYGGWRGIKPISNANGTLVFPLPNDGGEYNLILNGEGEGVQQDIATIIANQSYTFTAN